MFPFDDTDEPALRSDYSGTMTDMAEAEKVKTGLSEVRTLVLGVAGDVYVVIAAVSGRAGGLALVVALACAVFMVALWFGVPLAARCKPR